MTPKHRLISFIFLCNSISISLLNKAIYGKKRKRLKGNNNNNSNNNNNTTIFIANEPAELRHEAWRGSSIIEPYEDSIQAIQISSA